MGLPEVRRGGILSLPALHQESSTMPILPTAFLHLLQRKHWSKADLLGTQQAQTGTQRALCSVKPDGYWTTGTYKVVIGSVPPAYAQYSTYTGQVVLNC